MRFFNTEGPAGQLNRGDDHDALYANIEIAQAAREDVAMALAREVCASLNRYPKMVKVGL